MEKADQLLTTREVAQLLRVHPKQVYRLLERGLPALRVGDEWRFDRDRVLHWAGSPSTSERAAPRNAPTTSDAVPPALLAANGDCAVELLLGELRAMGGPLLGIVQADHAGAAELLAKGQVLVAGQHASEAAGGDPSLPKCGRLHLVQREVGLVLRAGSRMRSLKALPGKRFASRPRSAGVRRLLERELASAGVDSQQVHHAAAEYASHRDVAFAVLAGSADVGLTTQAWARRAQLSFLPLGAEAYELVMPAAQLGDERAVALCEAAQGSALRRRLRDELGYEVKHTGTLRIASP